MFPEISLMPIDLKFTSHETYYTCVAVAERVRQTFGIPAPVWRLTNRKGYSSHYFSPFAQWCWQHLTAEQKSDTLLDACAIPMGSGHGEGWYRDSASTGLTHTFATYPDISSFAELSTRLDYELRNPQSGLPKEVVRDGVHIKLIVNRLTACDALNPRPWYSPAVLAAGPDLKRMFTEPCIFYNGLSAVSGRITAPEIARLVLAMLIQTGALLPVEERLVHIIVPYDEWHTALAQSAATVLGLCRSVGVSLILANQSVGDVQQGGTDLTSVAETNTTGQAWFGSQDQVGIAQIEKLGGNTLEVDQSTTRRSDGEESVTTSTHVVPRFSAVEIGEACAVPDQFITRISRNSGYTHFNNMPLVARTGGYHLTKEEYESREKRPWPPQDEGTITIDAGPPVQAPTRGNSRVRKLNAPIGLGDSLRRKGTK